jgi:hypothetical protein
MCFHTNQNCLLFQPILKAAVSCNNSLYDTITLKIKILDKVIQTQVQYILTQSILVLVSCNSIQCYNPSLWFKDVQSRNLECILFAVEADCALKMVHVLTGWSSVFLHYLKIVSVHSLNELLERWSKQSIDIKLTEQVGSNSNISDTFGKCLVQILAIVTEVFVLSSVILDKCWASTIN